MANSAGQQFLTVTDQGLTNARLTPPSNQETGSPDIKEKTRMKRLTTPRRTAWLGLAGAAVLTVGLAQAQNNTGNDLTSRTQAQVDDLFKQGRAGIDSLHLTDIQKQKLRAIAQQERPQALAILADKNLPAQEKREKLRALTAAARVVLTPEQRQQAGALRLAAHDRLIEKLQWVSQELDLTPEQQLKIGGILRTSFQQGIAQHSQGGTPDLGQLRQLVVDTQSQVEAVLTPEQRSKWVVIRSAVRSAVIQHLKESGARNGAFAQAARVMAGLSE